MEPLDDWTEVAPWRGRLLLLLHIAEDGALNTAGTLTDKRAMLADETGVLIAVWPGQWATTARAFAPGDRAKVAERLG